MVRGILGDDAMFVMELEVFEAELHSTLVGCRLYVFIRAHAEEECNMDEVFLVF